ncbi:MAG: prolipoprotein diacylglyceryl transferase [Clostridia bacterium]|nr:prolipoprotein diacylglyceryl transferase [Clostridia bacterium]
MPTVDRVAFEIFGTPIYWYAIIIVIGMIIGVSIALFLAKRKGFVVDDILDIVLWVLPLAIIGARLYYVITDWDASWTFQRIFAIRDGGLAIYGGIIAGAITAIIVMKVKKMTTRDIIKILDCLVVGVIIGQSIGRWGNFVNMEAHGGLIANEALHFFPFGVLIGGKWYYATFFYESMWNLIGFVGLLTLNIKKPKWTGVSTLCYFIYYGIGRSWIEGLRTDSLYFLKNILGETIRISQALSIILVIVGIALLALLIMYDKKHPEKGWLNSQPALAVESATATETEVATEVVEENVVETTESAEVETTEENTTETTEVAE